jgi:putative transposase
LFGEIRRKLGPIFHELARQKECRIVEGHVMTDQCQSSDIYGPARAVKGLPREKHA